MIHLIGPFALVAVLAGCGTYGILARRNAVLMLVGVELVLASASLLLVTMSSVLPDRDSAGQVLTLFVITLAAAEVALALGIVLAAFRSRGHVDLSEPLGERADSDLVDSPGKTASGSRPRGATPVVATSLDTAPGGGTATS